MNIASVHFTCMHSIKIFQLCLCVASLDEVNIKAIIYKNNKILYLIDSIEIRNP